MELKKYIKTTRGALSRLARELNVSPSYMSQMAHERRPISIARCVEIEIITCGAVTRRDLRPNDWRDLWPELAGKEGVHA